MPDLADLYKKDNIVTELVPGNPFSRGDCIGGDAPLVLDERLQACIPFLSRTSSLLPERDKEAWKNLFQRKLANFDSLEHVSVARQLCLDLYVSQKESLFEAEFNEDNDSSTSAAVAAFTAAKEVFTPHENDLSNFPRLDTLVKDPKFHSFTFRLLSIVGEVGAPAEREANNKMVEWPNTENAWQKVKVQLDGSGRKKGILQDKYRPIRDVSSLKDKIIKLWKLILDPSYKLEDSNPELYELAMTQSEQYTITCDEFHRQCNMRIDAENERQAGHLNFERQMGCAPISATPRVGKKAGNARAKHSTNLHFGQPPQTDHVFQKYAQSEESSDNDVVGRSGSDPIYVDKDSGKCPAHKRKHQGLSETNMEIASGLQAFAEETGGIQSVLGELAKNMKEVVSQKKAKPAGTVDAGQCPVETAKVLLDTAKFCSDIGDKEHSAKAMKKLFQTMGLE
jgi:hypothetical protein